MPVNRRGNYALSPEFFCRVMYRFTIAFLLFGMQPLTFAAEVSIPLHLGNGYFQHLALKKIFNDSDNRFVAWNDGTGCNHLVLSEPGVSSNSTGVLMRMAGEGRAGTPVGNLCFPLLPWRGEIDVLMQPTIGADGKSIELKIVDSHTRDSRGKVDLGGAIWNWTKEYVHPRLSSLRIDLTGALKDVHSIARMLFPPAKLHPANQILASLTISEVTPDETGIALLLKMNVGSEARSSEVEEPALTAEEMARLDDKLLRWDVLVTLAARQAAAYTSDRNLRDALLAVLLNTRHEIVRILETTSPGSQDPVRDLFLETWSGLAPLLREISNGIPDDTALDYVSFIGALDALQAIDAAGQGLNLDISVDGLRRLARLIAPPGGGDPLFYNEGLDPGLRELFDFGLPVAPTLQPHSSGGGWLIRTALAQPTMAQIKRWLPTKGNIEEYLVRVQRLLDEVGDKVIEDKELGGPYRDMFRPLLLASAWQETCWRQFTVKDGKQEPLKSSVGAVGIMQVSPRVWRGFYQPNALNWDITYNATAGAEILHHYLVHYAIRKEEHKNENGLDNLVRATYSAYHGGPKHLTRYRMKNTSPKLRRIDEAFWRKYKTVRAGDPLAVQRCYQ